MKHAREDYNRFQDPEGKIPADEPVFLLRGQDPLAHVAVRVWAKCLEDIKGSPEMVKAARDHADAMALWARQHGRKAPDLH